MERHTSDQHDWSDVQHRLEAGESQSSIARSMGLTRHQFTYRMRKWVQQQREQGAAETASAYAVETENASLRGPFALQADQEFVLDTSFLDESWVRNRQRNRLVLMVKEPTTVFAYWEMDELRKRCLSEHFQSDWTQLPFFLQVYDVTDIYFNGSNAHSVQRIPVSPFSETWYLTGLQPGRRYLVDFGTTTWHGHFFTLLRSNIVTTPPQMDGQSYEPSVRFGTLHGDHVDQVNERSGRDRDSLEPTHELTVQESWQEQFDGYSLVERIGEDRA